MRPELEEIKLLEAYLQGSLLEKQVINTEIRLLWDLIFQKKVGAQRLSYEALKEAGRQQLKQDLKAIHNRLFL